MHGIGNDFVMVDLVNHKISELNLPELARQMCDRNFGIGADGLITASFSNENILQMRMFNPDGSESEMCGNGVRCFALFARKQNLTKESSIPVQTGAGLLKLEVLPKNQVKVDMGLAELNPTKIGIKSDNSTWINQHLPNTNFKGTAVSMGNPHIIIFVESLEAIELEVVGPIIENLAIFPNRSNVHFVKVISNEHIQMKTWERGAGITLACGTGACACCVASHLVHNTNRNLKVSLPGGDLLIEYCQDSRVFMTGPASISFEGAYLTENLG